MLGLVLGLGPRLYDYDNVTEILVGRTLLHNLLNFISHQYHIAGNFHRVQIFATFVDRPASAKIKLRED